MSTPLYRVLAVCCAFAVLIDAAALVDPVVMRSNSAVWSATLTVQPARYSDDAVSFTGRQYCYLGSDNIARTQRNAATLRQRVNGVTVWRLIDGMTV